MNHLAIMKEMANIIRGEHPAWGGDRILNAETFLRRIANDMPRAALDLADDLMANKSDFSDRTGLSPDRIHWAANRLRDGHFAASRLDQRIALDGDTWRIAGVGATREDGKTYYHLVSETRGRQQKNGWSPLQIADWIDLSEFVLVDGVLSAGASADEEESTGPR